MQTKIKNIALILLISLLLALVPSLSKAEERLDSIPYWSDTAIQIALQKSAQDDIYSDPLRPDNETKGALILSAEAEQLASTVESDVLGIIKRTDLAESEKVAQIKSLVHKLYLPPAEWSGSYDPANPSAYYEQFGLLNYLTLRLGSCFDDTPADQTDDTYCGKHSWLQYPNGDDAQNQTTDYALSAQAIRYYETQANLKSPIHATLGITLAETDQAAWLTGSGLLSRVTTFLTDLNNQSSDLLKLRTVAVDPTDPSQYLKSDGTATGEESEAALLPEYNLASTRLYHLLTPDQSLLTGKDGAFWGFPESGVSVTEITADFKSLSYIRARTIFEKAKKQKEDQYNAINTLASEINTVYGTLSASPYDMSTVVSTLEAKYKVINAIGGACAGAEDGYSGCIDAATNLEPLGHADHTARINAINNLLSVGAPSARGKYAAYRTQYEASPNLSDATTAASFESARDALLAARDAMLRYLTDLSELATSRIEEADQALIQLRETIGSDVSSTGAVNAIWSEVKRALVGLSTWLVNLFGRTLNFGLTEINLQDVKCQAVGCVNSTMASIHRITLGMANVSFVLLLVIAGLMIAMEWNIQAYSLRRLIPRFLMSAVLVNSSLFLARIFLDFSLILTNILLSQASAVSNNVLNVEIFARATAGTTGSTALGLSGAAPGLLFGSLLSSNIAALANSVFQNDIAAVIVLLLIVLIVAAVDILLIVRTVGVWLLMITSPLILMLNVLPSTGHLIARYVKLFIQLILIGPIVAIIFLIGIALAQLSLADDFLRVLIGIGTFALMLFSPMFLSFMSSLVKVTVKREHERPDRSFRLLPTGPAPVGRGGEPAQITNTSVQKDVKSSFSKTQVMDRTKETGLVDLSPQALETAVKSGILVNIEADKLEKILTKMDPSQRQSLLATFDDKDQRGVPLWAEEQKQVIREIVSPTELTRAASQAELIGKTRSVGDFDIDSLLKKNIGQKNAFIPQPTEILVNLLVNHRLGELEDRLERLAGQKLLTPEMSARLLEIQEGMHFVAGLLTSPEPKSNQTGNVITETYFGSDPGKIVERTKEMTTTVESDSRKAYETVLRVGVAELGSRLMQSPEDAELRRVATNLVLTIPKDIQAAFASPGPRETERNFFLSQGTSSVQTPKAAESTDSAQPGSERIVVEPAAPSFTIEQTAATPKLAGVAATNTNIEPGISLEAPLTEVNVDVLAASKESITNSNTETKVDIEPENKPSLTLDTINTAIQTNPTTLTSEQVNYVLQASKGGNTDAKATLEKLVEATNPTLHAIRATIESDPASLSSEQVNYLVEGRSRGDQLAKVTLESFVERTDPTLHAIRATIESAPASLTSEQVTYLLEGSRRGDLLAKASLESLVESTNPQLHAIRATIESDPTSLSTEQVADLLDGSRRGDVLAKASLESLVDATNPTLHTIRATIESDPASLSTEQVAYLLDGSRRGDVLAKASLESLVERTNPQLHTIRATIESDPASLSTEQVADLLDGNRRGDLLAKASLESLVDATNPTLHTIRATIESASASLTSGQVTYLLKASEQGDLIAKATLTDLVETMSGTPEAFQPAVRQLVVRTDTMTDTAKRTVEATPTVANPSTLALLNSTDSARQLLDTTLSKPEELTGQDIQLLLSRYDQDPVMLRDAVHRVVNLYNDNVRGEYSDQVRLSPSAVTAIQASENQLSEIGLPLRLSREQAEAELPRINQFAKVPADRLAEMSPDQYVPAISAFVENYPQLVLPEHIQYAINRLDQDSPTYRPVVQQILSPDLSLPTITVSRGLDQLIEHKPEFVLPEHINRAMLGLQTGNDTFASNLQGLASLYNEQRGAYGGPGQLTLPANTELSLQSPLLNRLLPDLVLNPFPSVDPIQNGAILAKGTYEQLRSLPDSLLADGMTALLGSNPSLISADQVGATISAARQNKTLMAPALSGLVNLYNSSPVGEARGPLPLPAMLTLASQAADLSAFGLTLSPRVTDGLGKVAQSKGFDLGGFDRLENAIREIPRALRKPPGTDANPKTEEQHLITVTDGSKGAGGDAGSGYHATQEALASDNIVQKIQAAKEAHAEVKEKQDGLSALEAGDIEDYVENLKENAGVLGVMQPDLAHTPEEYVIANDAARAKQTTEGSGQAEQTITDANLDVTPTLAALAISVPLLEGKMTDEALASAATQDVARLTGQDIQLLLERQATAPSLIAPVLRQLVEQLNKDDQGLPQERMLRLDAAQTLRANLELPQAS